MCNRHKNRWINQQFSLSQALESLFSNTENTTTRHLCVCIPIQAVFCLTHMLTTQYQQQWRKLTCQWRAWEIGGLVVGEMIQNKFKGTWKCSVAFNTRLSPLSMHTHGVSNSRCVQVTVNVTCECKLLEP